MKAKPKIFLSYAREDKKKVKALYRKLSAAGFEPWMDTENILPGEDWRQSIQKAIQCADFFFACLSKKAGNKKGFLQKEIKEALDIWKEKLEEDIYLVPVRLEKCETPENLAVFQWVNLYDKNGWPRLVKAIENGMERRDRVKTPGEPPGGPPFKSNENSISKPPKLLISAKNSTNKQLNALVMPSLKRLTLESLVEILVDHWDLPVWQDKPISYDLNHVNHSTPLDLTKRFEEIARAEYTYLCLSAVKDKLVLAQSPVDIPVFDVKHPEKEDILAILTFPTAITTTELEESLEDFWKLPLLLKKKPVYYELMFQDKPLPPYIQLSDSGITDDCKLVLTRRPGIRIIFKEEEKTNSQNKEGKIKDRKEDTGVKTKLEKALENVRIDITSKNKVPCESMTVSQFRKHLLNVMSEKMNEEDLEELLFNLDIQSDKFTGTKRARIRELIQYYRRVHNDDLSELVAEICDTFPHIKDILTELGCEIWLTH